MTEPATNQPPEGFVTININKERYSGPLRGGVNGRTYEVKVGSDQSVPAWVARSLRDTQIDFRIVAGTLDEDGAGAEGSAPAPSETETRTAIRGEEPNLDGSGGTPMKASELSAEPPLLGQVGGAQSGSAGQPANTTGTTVGPEGGDDESADDGDPLIAGKVSDVTSRITADTSDDDLAKLEAAEKDREKPRKGVLDAVQAERDRRAAAAKEAETES